MKTKQAAEREEQKRIKDLVLNYDLREGEEQDGDSSLAPLNPNYNIHGNNTGFDKAAGTNFARPDRSGNTRNAQRNRKLQLSDVDWYDSKPSFSHVEIKTPSARENGSSSRPATRPSQEDALKSPLERVNRPARATRQVGGRLTRKAILEAHANGVKTNGKK